MLRPPLVRAWYRLLPVLETSAQLLTRKDTAIPTHQISAQDVSFASLWLGVVTSVHKQVVFFWQSIYTYNIYIRLYSISYVRIYTAIHPPHQTKLDEAQQK